jgi:hypothetical protein
MTATDPDCTFASDVRRVMNALHYGHAVNAHRYIVAAARIMLADYVPLRQKHGSNGKLRARAYVPAGVRS